MRANLVIPCFNEAQRIKPAVFEEFLRQEPSVSFTFVNDGSRDDTRTVLERLQSRVPEQITVIHFPSNEGKAEAVRQGMRAAIRTRAEFVGFWDADLATPLKAIAEFLQVFASRPDVDCVFGARVKLLGRRIERKAARHYVGRAFATCASLTLRLPVYDTQCGAKLFRVTDELSAVLEDRFLSRWIFDVELISRLMKKRTLDTTNSDCAIFEFPLYEWKDVCGSKLRIKDYLVATRDLYRIHRSMRGVTALENQRMTPILSSSSVNDEPAPATVRTRLE